jgi:hypothetical protein
MIIDYSNKVNLFPSSIYNREPGSNIYKLWKLFALELNEIENSIRDWYDIENSFGLFLDKIGMFKGISRNGMLDSEYKIDLKNSKQTDIITLPSLYEVLRNYGSSFNILELHSPYLYDINKLYGSVLMDGTRFLNPNIVPRILRKLDGSRNLDGKDLLEPNGIRPLGLLIKLITNQSYPYPKVFSKIQKLLVSTTVYWEITIQISESETPPDLVNEKFIKYNLEVNV